MERIMFRVSKDKQSMIRVHVRWCENPVDKFLLPTIEETMQRDRQRNQARDLPVRDMRKTGVVDRKNVEW